MSHSFALQPYIDQFLSSAFTGNASALWHIVASAEAEFEIGRIEAVNIPMSPLSVPG